MKNNLYPNNYQVYKGTHINTSGPPFATLAEAFISFGRTKDGWALEAEMQTLPAVPGQSTHGRPFCVQFTFRHSSQIAHMNALTAHSPNLPIKFAVPPNMTNIPQQLDCPEFRVCSLSHWCGNVLIFHAFFSLDRGSCEFVTAYLV